MPSMNRSVMDRSHGNTRCPDCGLGASCTCDDPRYAHVRCATCGETHQRIDFYGNPHAAYCADPQIEGDPTRQPAKREDWDAISRARMQLWARC